VPRPGIAGLYVTTLGEAFRNQTKHQQASRRQILYQLDELNNRLKNARELLADQKVDSDDYRELKSECTIKINELETKLSMPSEKIIYINELLRSAFNNLYHLHSLYENGTIREKRKIIGSIYPEKLVFDGFQYRTARLNEAVRLIYTMDNGFNEIKNRKDGNILCLSGEVAPTGIEPVCQVPETCVLSIVLRGH
jgi:site-specific DNA recombinase